MLIDAFLPFTGIWANTPWSRSQRLRLRAMLSTLLVPGVSELFPETCPGCRVRACAIFMETRMNKDSFLKSALIGGVALGVLSALPVLGAVNCLCCAWVIGGGMFAAHLYVKEAQLPVTLGTGVLLGLLAGVIVPSSTRCSRFLFTWH